MSDKEVERNVRSSTREGIETPKQRHFHRNNFNRYFEHGHITNEERQREELLKKFRERLTKKS